jgi:NAD(P)-dependent dehydrogenase (short-subunit alcohol dehydrogenase family)
LNSIDLSWQFDNNYCYHYINFNTEYNYVNWYYLLARNEELGLKAVKQLQESNSNAVKTVKFHQLDITNVESIRRLADYIKKTHGGLNILINNAAIAFKVIQNKSLVLLRMSDF